MYSVASGALVAARSEEGETTEEGAEPDSGPQAEAEQ